MRRDGAFGAHTHTAVARFQSSRGLLPDGVVGAKTWAALSGTTVVSPLAAVVPTLSDARALEFIGSAPVRGFDQVLRPRAKPHGGKQTTLRADAAESIERIKATVQSMGGLFTSAGGKRALGVGGANRAFCSFHKTGLALDLATYSAMVDPSKDPMVCVKDVATSPDGRTFDAFRCFARVKDPFPVALLACQWKGGKLTEHKVTGNFIDLTALFAAEGWGRIPVRGSSRGGLEFWHYQKTDGLVVGETTFGDVLAQFVPASTLHKSREWKQYKRHTFTGLGFA